MNKDFLQSAEWQKFQGAAGRRTFCVSFGDSKVFVIEHNLPVVGKYFYIPRLRVAKNQKIDLKNFLDESISLAKKKKAGWIRFDANDLRALEMIRNSAGKYKIKKSLHDMQPKEIFVIDISKSKEELLAGMKSKTRYNIGLAERKGIAIRIINNDIDEFLRLNKIMAARQGITTHSDEYYRQMFKTIPEDKLKLYLAEYKGNIVAANIVVFYEGIATYLHGASDDKYKNLMAPYLLQWRAILDAKKAGCEKYDFGGVSFLNWPGITRFKSGFSPETAPVEQAGSYDIIILPGKYVLYKIMQRIKSWAK